MHSFTTQQAARPSRSLRAHSTKNPLGSNPNAGSLCLKSHQPGHQGEFTRDSQNGAKLLSLRIRAMSNPDNAAWEGDRSLKSGTVEWRVRI